MTVDRIQQLESHTQLIESKLDAFMEYFKEREGKEEQGLERRFARLEKSIDTLVQKLEDKYVLEETFNNRTVALAKEFDTELKDIKRRMKFVEGVIYATSGVIGSAVILALFSLLVE